MKKLFSTILCLTLLTAGNAYAVIFDVNVAPASVSASGKANVQLTIPASANQRTLPIDRALSSGAATPRLRTNRVSLNWNISCDAGFAPSSSSGTFFLDGRVIGGLGAITGPCVGANTSIPESVSIPRNVSRTILDQVLSQPLIKLTQTKRLRQSVTVTYRRTFRDSTGVAIQDTDTATLVFDVLVLAGIDPSDDLNNQSALVQVQGNAASSFQSISQSGNRPVRISWNAEIESSGEGSRLTIRSNRFEFRSRSGQVLQSQSKLLTEVFDPRFASNQFIDHSVLLALTNLMISQANAQSVKRNRINFTETIRIPVSVVNRARRDGSDVVRVVRVFTDGSNRIESFVDVPLSGQAGAGFQITRVDVRFSQGERLKVTTQGEAIQLIADINYLGTGFFKAIWEVAPVAAGGVPFFRPVPPSSQILQSADFSGNSFGTKQTRTLVRQYLNSFQRASFRSPVLPTSAVGQYLVRLRIDSPELLFESPVIQYFVGSSSNSAPTALEQVIPMTTTSPENDSEIKIGAEFSWKPVGLTVAYRYEIYSDSTLASDMVTGAVIPGDKESANLSALVAERLTPDKDYWWRVVAIDKNGLQHGASGAQKIRLAP